MIIIALNEEKNLQNCLSSLSFADEIIVVDSGSRDRTLKIARIYTHRVYRRDFDDFASQKNFAIQKAEGSWILSIDADEWVGPALAEEIQTVIKNSVDIDAYAIPRRTMLFEKIFRFSGLQNDKPVRLFRNGKASFKGIVHEVLKVQGKIGTLKQLLEHHSFQTFKEHWKRLETYTSLEAKKETRMTTLQKLLAKPFLRFLKIYALEQGFRDGQEGFFYAVLSSYYEFVRWAKIWEQKKVKADGWQ